MRAALHQMQQREENGAVVIEIDPNGNVPDRDFVLRWQEKPVREAKAEAWTFTDGEGQTHALLKLVAPEQRGASAGYSQDVYVLHDWSGSMVGQKWTKSVEALHRLVKELGDNDRVWITFFSNRPSDFASRPLPAAELRQDRCFLDLSEEGPGGGTEMLPAAEQVLKAIQTHSLRQEREATVILITDGQTAEEHAVMAAFKKYVQIRVHAIGIDTTVNDALLRSLARQQRGQVVLHTPNEDIAGSIQRLVRRLRQPVLLDLQPGPGWETPSAQLPDLYAGEIATFCLRATQPGARLALRGKLPQGTGFPVELTPQTSTNPAIALLWAKERITQLLENGQRGEATELSIKTNLVCATTAFVAVDDSQTVDKAEKEIYQPSQAPLFLGEEGQLFDRGEAGAAAFQIHLARLRPSAACVASGDVMLGDLGVLPQLAKSVKSLTRDLVARLGEPDKTDAQETAPKSPGLGAPPASKPTAPDLNEIRGSLDELRGLPVFQTVIGRRFLRLLDNWVKDKPSERESLVAKWIDTLRGKTIAEVIAACIEFARSQMTDEAQAVKVASAL
jgi:hypothetical protein